MKSMSLLLLTAVLLLTATPSWSQSNDTAAERARLANQRIQLEMERRARAEEEQRKKAEEEAARQAAAEQIQQDRAMQDPVSSIRPARQPAVVPQETSGDMRLGMPRSLEQIKMLGELKDAGYVTDDEFERIKKRLLDGEL